MARAPVVRRRAEPPHRGRRPGRRVPKAPGSTTFP